MGISIYLPGLDISENGGTERVLDASSMIGCILLADKVTAQGSVALKREDVLGFTLRHIDCFRQSESDSEPAVSMLLSESTASYSEYIENRMETLERLPRSALNSNHEYKSYVRNKAKSAARTLDERIPLESRRPRRGSVDTLFRKASIEAFQREDGIARQFALSDNIVDGICKHIKEVDLFQTNAFRSYLGRSFGHRVDWSKTLHELRMLYHRANCAVAQSQLPYTFTHLRPDCVASFFRGVGLSGHLVGINNGKKLLRIRQNQHFQKLRAAYLKLDPRKALDFERLVASGKTIHWLRRFLLPAVLGIATATLFPENKYSIAVASGASVLLYAQLEKALEKTLDSVVNEICGGVPLLEKIEIAKSLAEFKKELPTLIAA